MLRFAKCPVLTIREIMNSKPAEALNNILVPIDFSDHAQQALTYVKEIATSYNTRLQLFALLFIFFLLSAKYHIFITC